MAARRHASRGPSRLWPFKARDDIVTIADLGAQKIACAIVSLTAPRFGLDTGARNVRVLGSAIVRSSGFSGGRIVNIAAAETSVRRAVAQAEAEAGITAGDVVVTGQFDGLPAQVFEAKPAAGEGAALQRGRRHNLGGGRRGMPHRTSQTAAHVHLRRRGASYAVHRGR